MSTAFTAKVTMHNAAWGDETGSTVTFKLPMTTTGDIRNPFHSFTKRRKGKAGTRFMMACLLGLGDTRQPLYEDEVMLAGWNDSQQHGHTVKFWICNDNMGHPFEGIGRTEELMLSLVELDDDNQPIDQKMRERVEKQHDRGKQRLSNVAAMMGRTYQFWEWANSTDFVLGFDHIADEELAKMWIYQALGIKSRAELDTNAQLAQQFELKIRKPYETWYSEHYGEPF